MQRQKQSEALGGQLEIRIGEQRGRRARKTAAEALVLLAGREVVHTRRKEAVVQFAALLLQQRQGGDELDRRLDMLARVDELLEVVERKGGFFHRAMFSKYA